MQTSALPTPIHAPAVPEEEETFQRPASTSTPPPVASPQPVPPYGRRNGWKPMSQEDYGALFCTSFDRFLPLLQGDGGAYPECHIAQYPLDMGRKKVCLLEYIPIIPSHSAIGFLRKHISPSSGQRGQCSLRCYCTPRAAIRKAGSVSVQGSCPVGTPKGRE